VLDIADGAHHSDLMFSMPSDSGHLRKARAAEMAHMRRWVREAERRRRRMYAVAAGPAAAGAAPLLQA
jgi:hypothetical protein